MSTDSMSTGRAGDGPEETAAWITSLIETFIAESPENNLGTPDGEPAWAAPLVGFARGDDPIFQRYKEVVGPFHWTPAEAFALAHPGVDVEASALSVVAWILPQTEATKADNRRQTTRPAERWARSRIFGEAANNALRDHVARTLTEAGHPAVAPMRLPQWETHESDDWYTFSSNWSERHAAYAAGLGTFGLCDGLITPKGKAMRAGAVVARVAVEPTPRPYSDHHAYCLLLAQGTCGECIARCPAGAISRQGHDKATCSRYVGATRAYVEEQFGFEGYGCGLCQTGVPCESGIPT